MKIKQGLKVLNTKVNYTYKKMAQFNKTQSESCINFSFTQKRFVPTFHVKNKTKFPNQLNLQIQYEQLKV